MVDRKALLESYRKGYNLLKEALVGTPDEAWHFKPASDQWSIHEIIIHIADSEVNGYIRLRKILAENGTTVSAYNQDAWTNTLHYNEQDIHEFLELFNHLRQINYRLLNRIEDSRWENFIVHPESGMVKLEDWLRNYDNHIYTHINQIKRNINVWKESARK